MEHRHPLGRGSELSREVDQILKRKMLHVQLHGTSAERVGVALDHTLRVSPRMAMAAEKGCRTPEKI